MTVIVVLGLVVVVILVVVLVALGVRASRQAREGDEGWVGEEQPTRGRRGAHLDEEPGDGYGTGYDRRVAGAPIGASSPLSAPVDPAAAGIGPAPRGADRGYDPYDQGYDPAYDQPGYEHGGYDQPAYDQAAYDQGGYDQGGYDQGFEHNAPAAGRPQPPAPVQPQQPLAARRGRATEEMEDDDYWATITFDKPKFPWQHDTGHRPQGEDPLAAVAEDEDDDFAAPAAGPQPGYGADVPVAGYGLSSGPATGDNLLGVPLSRTDRVDPFERSAGTAPTGPQALPDPLGHPDPLGYPDPLGTPVARDHDRSPAGSDTQFFTAGDTDLPAAPPHPSTMATQNFSVGSMGTGSRGATRGSSGSPLGSTGSAGLGSAGPLGGGSLAGTGPLSAPTPPPAPVSPPPPVSSSTPPPSSPGASALDSDPHRLPTVDELLQRIQTDRRKSSESSAPSSSYGGSDPLSDPLSPSGSSWSGATSFDQDPLNTSGGYRPSATPGYSSSSDGYPATPAYGSEPTRYDDPLSGSGLSGSGYGGSSGAGRESYGSYGGQSEPASSEPGKYGDFSGSSYSGPSSPDPLGGSRGYPDTPATGGYGSSGSGGYPSEPSYGGLPPQTPDYGYGHDRDRDRDKPAEPPAPGLPDDWDTYRGPHR